jgi:uncharacterized protein YwgA
MQVLRRGKAIEILFALENGPKHVRELQSEVGGSASTVEMRIQEFLDGGLIREKKFDCWPFRKELELSEKGKEVIRAITLQNSLLTPPAPLAPEKRAKWILILLHTMGGKIKGRVRFQKLVFLLQHEFDVQASYKFVPYVYGPYSSDIFEDAVGLQEEGLLRIVGESHESRELFGGRGSSTDYTLTADGEEKARELYEKLSDKEKQALSSLKQRFDRADLQEILKHVYSKYPRESLGAASDMGSG